MESFISLFDPSSTTDETDTENSSNSSSDSESLDKIMNAQTSLPPEPQFGNIEYKLKLINPGPQRLEHLVTQMKWRLREGNGEAIYEIGIADSGEFVGLCPEEMKGSLETLNEMAAKLGATTNILRRTFLDNLKSCVEVLVRRIPDDKNVEVRISVMGAADAGKSSMIGVLTQGEMDNGRGRARLNMFRHMHEIMTGRTSCISHELLGFDNCGNIINYGNNECTAEEISDRSSKLISFMDLAGHRRYMRTTVQAISGYSPHFIGMVIAAGNLNQMSIENLTLIKAFKIPFFVVLTKIDLVSPDETLHKLENILAEMDDEKSTVLINTVEDLLAFDNDHHDKLIPIFYISNVTGVGLDLLQKYLFMLAPTISKSDREKLEKETPEFQIDEIFRVQEVGGQVVGGLLVKGILEEKMLVKIGPGPQGEFWTAQIKNIYRNKHKCRFVRPNQSASLSFSMIDELPLLRHGMVLLPDNEDTIDCTYFFQVISSLFLLILIELIYKFLFNLFRQQ